MGRSDQIEENSFQIYFSCGAFIYSFTNITFCSMKEKEI